MGMWFEILPSIVIMTTIYVGGDALSKLVLKSIYGVRKERDITNSIDQHMWKRDYQHSYSSTGSRWLFRAHHGSPYKGHGLEMYDE